jgi:hypothetical protein
MVLDLEKLTELEFLTLKHITEGFINSTDSVGSNGLDPRIVGSLESRGLICVGEKVFVGRNNENEELVFYILTQRGIGIYDDFYSAGEP